MWADQNRHLDEAEDYIKRALASDPENGAFLDSMGWLHYRQGKYEQALTDSLNAAQELEADDPTVFEHIGDTYSVLNQDAQALEYWQKALVLDQTDKKLAVETAEPKSRKAKTTRPAPRRAMKDIHTLATQDDVASLTAIFVVLLVVIVNVVVWMGRNVIGFLQPIYPVAIERSWPTCSIRS